VLAFGGNPMPREPPPGSRATQPPADGRPAPALQLLQAGQRHRATQRPRALLDDRAGDDARQQPDRAASSQSRSVNPAKGKVGFAEWAERWFATTADLKPGTRRTYRMLLDNQVLPHFGTATLAGIDTLAVREWVAGLVEGGLSPSRIRIAHQVLSQALAAGVEGGRLARNPAAGVRLPKRVEREMLFLDAAQVEQLVDAIGPHYRTLRRRACSSARAPGSRRRRRPSATAPR